MWIQDITWDICMIKGLDNNEFDFSETHYLIFLDINKFILVCNESQTLKLLQDQLPLISS